MQITNSQKQKYKDYLSVCVKYGVLDIDEALEIIRKQEWDKVEHMMRQGDIAANGKDE